MYRISIFILIILLTAGFMSSHILANQNDIPRTVTLGYFEPGNTQMHDLIRAEFTAQLKALSGDSLNFMYVPYGYKSGAWNRDSCRIKAGELVASGPIDIIIAIGPWVVEELLAAGYSGAILSMYRVDPFAEGLLDENGRPIADNLTVHFEPDHIEQDLAAIHRVLAPRKLGLLFFPSGDESNKLIARIKKTTDKLGITLIPAEKYDRYGTYAYFKSYSQLRKKVDVLYLGPLWGLHGKKTAQFLTDLSRDRVPTLAYDGGPMVHRGALMSNSGYSLAPAARFNALKALLIAQGDTPADLPVSFASPTGLIINEQTAHDCHRSFASWITGQALIVNPVKLERADHYSLTDAIFRVLDQNPSILARKDAVRAAKAAVAEAKSGYLPQIGLGFEYNHFDNNSVYNSLRTIKQDGHSLFLSLEQPLLAPQTMAKTRIARQQQQGNEIVLRQIGLDLELAVTEAFVAFLEAERRLHVERFLFAEIGRTTELTRTRQQLENGDFPELSRFNQMLLQTESQIRTAEAALAHAEAGFNALLNMPLDNPFELIPSSLDREAFTVDYQKLAALMNQSGRLNNVREYLIEQARSHNPELNLHAAQIRLQKQMLSLNKSRFYPRLGLHGSLNHSNRLADIPGEFEEKKNYWSVGASLRLPLFEGGQRFKEKSRLKAHLSQVEFERDAVFLDVARDVTLMLEQVMSAASNLMRSANAETLALQSLKTIGTEYDADRLSYLHLVDALQNARTAQLDVIVYWKQYHTSLARLVRIVGWSAYRGNRNFNKVFFENVGAFLKRQG